MEHTAERRARWMAPALLVLGVLGCAAAWLLLASLVLAALAAR